MTCDGDVLGVSLRVMLESSSKDWQKLVFANDAVILAEFR